MRTESPQNTAAAALIPSRRPRREATDSTYSELGPGSRMMRTVATT
jgi:hypothetical protein